MASFGNRFVKQNMAFLNAKDESKYFEQFIRYTKKLDASRNTDAGKIIKEFIFMI